MIMEYINTHTHTGLTGHGNGTIAEVVQAADEAGISILALTEHFPLSHEVDPDNFVSMPWDALDPTIAALKEATDLGANVVLTHHPVFIEAVSNFMPETVQGAKPGAVVTMRSLTASIA